MSDIFDKRPFSINDLACDEEGDPVKTNMDIWLDDVKAEYRVMQSRLMAIQKLRDNYDFDDVTGIDSFTGEAFTPSHTIEDFLEELDKILQGSTGEAT